MNDNWKTEKNVQQQWIGNTKWVMKCLKENINRYEQMNIEMRETKCKGT